MINKKLSSLQWGEEISFPSSRKGEMFSHVVGARYPCRSVPFVPRLILSEIEPKKGKQVNVLDPFMGSGTTALEANLKSFNAYGLEVDPYARMIGEASVQRFSADEIEQLSAFAIELEKNFKKTRSASVLIPDIPNIYHWFPEKNVVDLARLKSLITAYADINHKFGNFLFAAFADIIRGASFAERQSLKPYVSSRFEKKPGEVLPLFKKCLEKYIDGARAVSTCSSYGAGKIIWVDGDATTFNLTSKIDVAITSPPYINAMDYVRCIKLESSWVGTGASDVFSTVRASQVGEAIRGNRLEISSLVKDVIQKDYDSIALLDTTRAKTLAAYFEDMCANLRCVFKSLKKGGSYHIIVGDSVVRGISVPTHRYIAEIAGLVGFEWSSYFKYQIKDHRTSLPRNGRGGKINFEHVITLRKP